MTNSLLLGSFAILAALATGGYAVIAAHVAWVQYPAHARVGAEAALVQWVNGASMLQPAVASVGCVAALLAAALSGDAWWSLAAALIGFVVPFTLVVMPIHRSMFAAGREPESAETRRLLKEWGAMHRVRTGLSVAAAALMSWQLLHLT
jgi:hypothetical protein